MKSRGSAQGRRPDLAGVKAFYASGGADFGPTHPAALLAQILNALIVPMQTLLEVNRQNPGGRPTLAERRYLIQQLALAAPPIIGGPATVSLTGSFVEFCEQVAVTCGLSAAGIDKAAASVVKEFQEGLKGESQQSQAERQSAHGRWPIRAIGLRMSGRSRKRATQGAGSGAASFRRRGNGGVSVVGSAERPKAGHAGQTQLPVLTSIPKPPAFSPRLSDRRSRLSLSFRRHVGSPATTRK